MSDKVDLRVDWCSYEAAKYAVEKWHYSQSMPTPPIIKIGAWENNKYIGCVLFSRGANNNLGKTYNLLITEVCELTRIALSVHMSPVSQIASKAIKFLCNNSPGLRLIVSYADPREGHHGGVYQAMNWVYVGQGQPDIRLLMPNGKLLHSRQFSVNGIRTQYGEKRRVPTPNDGKLIKVPGKHKYLYPLDRAMRKQIAPLAQPYPKRVSCGLGVESDTVGDQPTGAGATPAARSEV